MTNEKDFDSKFEDASVFVVGSARAHSCSLASEHHAYGLPMAFLYLVAESQRLVGEELVPFFCTDTLQGRRTPASHHL